jgi:hypothetical protein
MSNQPYPNHNGGRDRVSVPTACTNTSRSATAARPAIRRANGQRVDTLLAKLLRVDVDRPDPGKAYGIPPDNPYVGIAGARSEIWMTGLCANPWRFRFDPATGDLWIGDVGRPGGRRSTWPGRAAWPRLRLEHHGRHSNCYQPSDGCDQFGLTQPVAVYGHDLGCAVIGGVVFRGRLEGPLAGRYVFGDAARTTCALDPAADGRRAVIAATIRANAELDRAADDGTVLRTQPLVERAAAHRPPGAEPARARPTRAERHRDGHRDLGRARPSTAFRYSAASIARAAFVGARPAWRRLRRCRAPRRSSRRLRRPAASATLASLATAVVRASRSGRTRVVDAERHAVQLVCARTERAVDHVTEASKSRGGATTMFARS